MVMDHNPTSRDSASSLKLSFLEVACVRSLTTESTVPLDTHEAESRGVESKSRAHGGSVSFPLNRESRIGEEFPFRLSSDSLTADGV